LADLPDIPFVFDYITW